MLLVFLPIFVMDTKIICSYNFVALTLEKRFFVVATFEGLWVVSFQTELKDCSILGLYKYSLDFQSMRIDIVFLYVDSFISENVNLSWKELVVFLLIFVVDTKLICSYNFVAPLKHLSGKAHTLHSFFQTVFLPGLIRWIRQLFHKVYCAPSELLRNGDCGWIFWELRQMGGGRFLNFRRKHFSDRNCIF